MVLEARPVTLEGEHIILEPLSQAHAQGLYTRGREAAEWAYMPRRCFVDLADARQWIDEALEAAKSTAFRHCRAGQE